MINLFINTEEWANSINKDANDIHKVCLDVFKEVSELVLENTIRWTPVGNPELWNWPAKPGYTPGTLKKSWNLSFNKDVAIINNDQPYAQRVEYGWSSQAPNGMLRRAAALFPKLVDLTARKYNQ